MKMKFATTVNFFSVFIFFAPGLGFYLGFSEYRGAITWRHNCSDEVNTGTVRLLHLTDCWSIGCMLKARSPFRLLLLYAAEGEYESLDYIVRLHGTAGQNYLLGKGNGIQNIRPGKDYYFGFNFVLNGTIPTGTYMLRLARLSPADHRSVLCVEFEVSIANDMVVPETTTTVTMATTLLSSTAASSDYTTLPTSKFSTVTLRTSTTTAGSAYTCSAPGTFPDPSSCTIFHVCQQMPDGSIWDQQFSCPIMTVYCSRTQQCEFPRICPCNIAKNLFIK